MTPRDLLSDGAHQLGIELSIEEINSIFLFLAELKKWNRKINLTAIREESDIVIKHVLDSLSYLKGFDPFPGLQLLDIGSGAGFPALLIKIVRPGIAVTLVESTGKKASFLRHCMRTLALTGLEIKDERLEKLPNADRAAYDIVTARAFADMPSAVSAGAPFLKPGGRMVLSRGPEEAISVPELARAGMAQEKRIDLVLPHSYYKRSIWVFRRSGEG